MAAWQVVVSRGVGDGPTRRRLVAVFSAALLALVGTGLAGVAADARPVPGGYVQIEPDSVTLTVRGMQPLHASVTNPMGFELPDRRVLWTSSHPPIATVDASGVVSGVAAGQATLTARSGAALGTVTVTVNGVVTPPPNAAPTVTITAPEDGATFTVDGAVDFQATAEDPEEGNISDSVVWTATAADAPDTATVQLGTGAAVSSTSLAAGTYVVTAQATDTFGLVGMAQVGITVNGIVTPPPDAAPTVTITAPENGATFNRGMTGSPEDAIDVINFEATADDPEDGDISAQVVWTAMMADDPDATPTPLGTGAAVSTTSLAAGSYVVTAQATDIGGSVGTAQVGIRVDPCILSASLTPPTGVRLPQVISADASGSTDSCGRPLQFFWGCTSTMDAACTYETWAGWTLLPPFLEAANANDNTTATAQLVVNEYDSYDITVTVCVAGTNECAPRLTRVYDGAEVSPWP
jgi:hypothetical protein